MHLEPLRGYLSAAVFLVLATAPVLALTPDERAFFGLTALEASNPGLDGAGFSFGVSDTEFDLTHPGLGWVSSETFAQWSNSNAIPNLTLKNPRVWSAGHAQFSDASYTNRHHGVSFYSFNLPVKNNNTITPTIWGTHGTAVAGTAGSGTNGPLGNSRGVAPRAKLVLAGDTANMDMAAGLVPDGNPYKTVAINRSFTGSSFTLAEMRRNSGLVTVNAAGNDFGGTYIRKTQTYGMSPEFSSIRWLSEKGYDVIASGFYDVTASNTFNAPYGSQRNTESIWTDFQISTLSPDGQMDVPWGGTSFSSPFTVGGLTLLQQAYANTHSGRWLRTDQLLRILRKTARFMDDQYTGLRCPGADFAAGVALATNYPGDPGLEPNFTEDFSETNHINYFECASYPDPRRFRTDIAYGSGTYDFTGPRTYYNTMGFSGNDGPGRCNIALRNGWGDLALVDLNRPGKKIAMAFDFDTNPGWVSGTTETYVGFKEMVGSDQFMDANRETDSEAIGRVAFKIIAHQGSDQCTVQALRCSEVPDTNDVLWARTNLWAIPSWDAPLASVTVTNLTLGNFPVVTFEFDATHMRFLRGSNEILNVAHGAPAFALSRATPYLHFQNGMTDHVTRLRNFRVETTSGSDPVVALQAQRLRALEGVAGFGPAAVGVLTVTRDIATSTPLVVSYTVSGTASDGADYASLPGSITIPAGAAAADLVIHPLDDAALEPDETVVVQLAAGAGYDLGGAVAQTVVLVDFSDADGDGLANSNENPNAAGGLLDDDTDLDMLQNYLDADDDGDRVDTPTEDRNSNGDPRDDDTDSDTTPDFLDTDDDGDGRTTLLEDHNRNGNPLDDDYDNDSIPDYLDTDPVPYSDFTVVSLAGTFNGWYLYENMALTSNSLWQRDLYFAGVSGVEFKFAASNNWTINWGDNQQTNASLPVVDVADPGGSNIAVNGVLTGTYRFTFNDATLAYSVAYVPPTDADNDGMADDWETANNLNPGNPGDASGDPDLDGFTNLEEFQKGFNPHVWDPRLTGYTSMSVAATFNNWNAGANNMKLVGDYTWRYVGTFRAESNIQFKFAAGGNWDTNWGDNNQADYVLPLTNGVGEAGGANIVISNTLDGLYAFTFNEQTLAYDVTATCDDYCDLVAGITQIVSPGVPGPIMGAAAETWKAIAGGDDDASTPSGFVLARKLGGGRVVAMGHDGLVQQLDDLDNRAFMVNVMQWLNDGGAKQVAYTEGHGEWVKGPQLAALSAEMTNHGYAFASITGEVTTANLAGKDVLVIGNAWQAFGYGEFGVIENFVASGGSLLMLGLGWSWNGLYYDDYPMNRIGERFQVRWLRGYIQDPTHSTNGSPVFHTFYPRVPYYDLNEATGRIAAAHAAHPADLPAALESDSRLRLDYLVAQGALVGVSRDFNSYTYERYSLREFCQNQASNYPNYFAKTNYFDPLTRPVMSRMRERFIRTWMDADYLSTMSKDAMSTLGQYPGGYSNIWRDFTVYLMDNRSLDATQLLAISSTLGTIPVELHNTRAISVTDFIGASVPDVSLEGRDGQVNIFGLKVGALAENPFPSDVAPRTSDVFTAVTAHELNHIVDAYTIKQYANFEARKTQLIAAAGTNRYNYLRGGDGLEFLGHGFFTQNPQEFFASIANQWFTDSEQVFELGYARFTNGIPHPINQALFFADVYSRQGPLTRFMKMDAPGHVTNKTVTLLRNTNGFIHAVSSDSITWFFGVDGSGNVTNVVRTDGTADQDSDGMRDQWEIQYGFDPLNGSDASADPDGDGLSNLEEFGAGTHPHRADTDLDGTTDLLDPQPTTPAYRQVYVSASAIGTAQRVAFWWTTHSLIYNFAAWGAPSYVTSEGFVKFDVSSVPDNAVIRNVALVYDTSSYKYMYSMPGADTEVIALDATDPAPPAEAEPVYNAIATGSVLQVCSGTNGFPFGTWRQAAADWGPAVEANLAARLGADTWSLGFRAGTNNSFYAYVSNATLVISYETNGPYTTAYDTMTLAGTLNGWNPVANNMVLVSNYTWRFEGDVRNVSGAQFKFAADRSWNVNWGDNNPSDAELPIQGTAESAGANIAVTGVLDGTLRVTFHEQSGAYSIELQPRADTDSDGMPDDWEIENGLDPDVNDAAGNPDGDLYTNLEEYRNGTDPHAWNPPNSHYGAMAVAGTFNDWAAGSANMTLVSNFTWRFELPVTNVYSVQFKFAANGNWDTNWGDNDQASLVTPISGTGERDGANIQVNGPVDGTLRFTFFEASANYTVERIPPADTDSDGMPDYWEDEYALDKNAPGDATLDSDGDGFDNLSEYQRRTNPRVPDAMNSNYSNMTVAADFNGWNAGANNMRLVDHYTWQYTVGLDQPAGIAFKFAANGGWAINWGETNQSSPFTEPLQGTAETNGGNILLSGPLNGTYVFLFNENTRAYSFTRSQVADFDQDGAPDDWESAHGFNARDGSDAGQDADGDLLENLEEYENGTDPNAADTDGDGASDLDEVVAGTKASDASSFLEVVTARTGSVLRITWPGASGRAYNLLQRASLVSGDWSPVPDRTNMSGHAGTMETTLELTNGVPGFYLINVRKSVP